MVAESRCAARLKTFPCSGGIALSSDRVFYCGDTAMGAFDRETLAGVRVGSTYDTLVSDLRTQTVYTFADVAGKTLDEFADDSLLRWERNMRNVNVFTQVSRQRVTLPGDLPAIEVVHHIGRGTVGKSRKFITVFKNRAFWIDAEMGLDSWADYAPDFNRIAESFRVQD